MYSSSHKTAVIADDHPIILHATQSILMSLGYNVKATFQNGTQALRYILTAPSDLVLLDIQMPGLSGLDIAEQIISRELKTKIIIYTMFTEHSLFQRARDMGISGYLLKEFATEELRLCVKALENDQSWFSPRLEESLTDDKPSFQPDLYNSLTAMEKAIVQAIAQKKTTKDISSEHFISPKTVENHRANIIKKLQLPHTHNSLLIWALENKGFLSMTLD